MKAPRGFFITGTDTDAGKTVSAAAVLVSLRTSGIDAVPMKPVQTGGVFSKDRLHSPDIDFCLRMAALSPDPEEICDMVPYIYRQACSPHLAAAKEGREISISRIVEAFGNLKKRHECVVVEGAGGLLAPIGEDTTMVDLMAALGLPVILVARPGLGTINHTMLSVRELKRSGLHLHGIVFCETTSGGWGEIEQNNMETIARLAKTQVLGRIGYMEELSRPDPPSGLLQKALPPDVFRGETGMERPYEVFGEKGTQELAGGVDAYNEIDRASLWHPYTKHSSAREGFPVIARGEGVYLFDTAGNRYLDAISSWWACNLGHGNKRLVGALVSQARKLQHSILGNLTHPRAVELGSGLAKVFPDTRRRTLFASDGASAVEAALRVALQYWHNRGESGRTRFAAFEDGYHGDTIGAMSVGYLPAFHKPYSPVLFPVHKIKTPDCCACPVEKSRTDCGMECFSLIESVVVNHARELAAVIVEPLCLGAAGMKMYPADCLRRLAELCRQNRVLLIVDEIAMGFGRTGKMFAFDHAGIDPDIVCIGKGLSGGYLPISAAVVKEEIFTTFADEPLDHTFYHGHTFAGNPVAAAVAVECLDIYREENIVERAETTGKALAASVEGLRDVCGVENLRTLGMIAAFDLTERKGVTGVERARRICSDMLKKGVLIRPLGPTLYLMPPLIADTALLEETAASLLDAVKAL
ncbi:MAG: adenosylmethionine--8-amino-7-oxononanoate transaminase [Syntrophobacteraceae bacterium]|nr:adenosylmethionine--8-amino-7-oxononanoate transaminase [Syntrophobacteraceae bacterium]